ncbi:hypothetical protein DL98DRAFT_656795 [Cadophora sp. DSE1049]|nr:hypothetical protein DL98DRAFT_656795 [Cadophora sp. DSE1049]
MAARAGVPTPQFEDEFRYWDDINDPNAVLLTNFQVQTRYAASQAVLYAPPVPPPAPPLARAPTALGGIIKPLGRPPLAPAPVAAHLPLLAPVPGVPAAAMGGINWIGVKHLGTGGGGAVTMWEWNGPAAGRPAIHDRIVIKLQPDPGPELLDEGAKLTYLNQANPSEHIVELLVSPATRMTPAMVLAENLPNAWLAGGGAGGGDVRRLVMEYLPQGSLHDLRGMRIGRNIRFEELTLWRIFECLVDGCNLLEHRENFTANNDGVPLLPLNSISRTPAADPGVLVHFDIKPENILLAPRSNPDHTDTPLCKIADFGLSLFVDRNPDNVFPHPTWAANQTERYRGTVNYLTPVGRLRKELQVALLESKLTFHARNNFQNVGITGIIMLLLFVGNGAGKRMSLACYDKVPVEPHRPFQPAVLIGATGPAPAKGILYGADLQILGFSQNLKDAIHECLYEIPDHRPTLLQLKRRIKVAIDACLAADLAAVPPRRPEGWQNLARTEPLVPAQAAARPEIRTQCTFFGFINREPVARLCNVQALRRANPLLAARCHNHWDLRRYP